MFIIKGKNGETIVSCEEENLGKEIVFNSYDDAEKMLETISACMPDGYFNIEEKLIRA